MTIKLFEHEAVLSLFDTSRISTPCESSSGLPRKPPLLGGSAAQGCNSLNGRPPFSTSTPSLDESCPDLLSLDSDEEDCFSLSSCSSASSFSRGGHERRVSFAAPLVTEVRFRARTPEADKPLLFYSEKETTRFRQLYRQERKSSEASGEESDVQTVTQDPSFYVEAEGGTLASTVEPPVDRRRISRVVVEHNDSFETFYDLNDLNPLHKGEAAGNDVFFDNDSFWSGSITWY
jgi:hypothetical protein